MATTSNRTYQNSEIEGIARQNGQKSHPSPENRLNIIMLIDGDGIVTYASPSLIEVLGDAPEEIVGNHFYSLVHPNDLMVVQQTVEEVRQTPGQSLNAHYRLCGKDSVWHWFTGNKTNLLQVPGVGAIVNQLQEIAEPDLVSHHRLPEISEDEHFVQFYETDEFLLHSISSFVSRGLDAGDACIVVATRSHREGVEERLRANGLDLTLTHAHDQYIALDAGELLSQFMVGNAPDRERFVSVVGNVIEQAAQGGRPVRIFGEMVALLCEEGNATAAIRLEEFWNDLNHNPHVFTLFCAYPIDDFTGETHSISFSEICNQHSHVVPDESYTTLLDMDSRLRAITQLQQKANSLEIEIAERKIAEKRLRESAERFRFLAESMPQKIFTTTPTGEVDYFNPQWMEFTGLSFEDSKDWGWTQFVHPDDLEEHLSNWKYSVQTGKHFYHELRYRRADGVYCWHMCRAIPMYDTDKNITMWIGSVTDIDEQKKSEERKNAFISMASHELKTPVTSLKGFTQVLQRRLKEYEDPQIQLFLNRMDAQLTKLTSLISDLLDVSKMQTGMIVFREMDFDLDAMVRETVENVQAITATHRLHLQGRINTQIYGDRDRLEQVLINLLTNAIKYSPGADTVNIQLSQDHEQIQIQIQDFGIGVDAEHHERIFERFYQVPGPQEKTYPGLGIGLYIARTIVERHHGRLWLESTRGSGSTFHFTIPLPRPGISSEKEGI
jgi:PAS domain S-box-containing protein